MDEYAATVWKIYIHENNQRNEKIPNDILQSPESVVVAYLVALMGGPIQVGAEYRSNSERLCIDVQILLAKLGYLATLEYVATEWVVKIPDEYDIAETVNGQRFLPVRSVTKLPEQQILYDYTLPNTKSFYAGGFRNHNCDERNSVNTDVFETVVMGFAAVSQDPIGNIEYYNRAKYLKSIKDIDGLRELNSTFTVQRNQIVISGTAGHQFQPFYKDFSKYKILIESKGDHDYLKKHLGADEIPESFDYRDYSICHIPYSLIKEYAPGFMDEATVAKAKATMDSDTYLNEYEAIFTQDSAGFFKASIVNRNTEKFRISKVGDQITENQCLGHLFGIDVASEFDNFAVCVLAIYPTHAKIKNIWTTNRKSFEERQKLKLTDTTEYYSFCTRKVRELMQCFPP
jgi:hypothetical protein